MLKFIVGYFVFYLVIFTERSHGHGATEKMIGEGRWFVINIRTCDNAESFEHTFGVWRKKINRTHDGFWADMTLKEAIDSSYGIRIDMCKHVDGGCKPYQVLSDESFVGFVEKYASNNVEVAFTSAGIDPPGFPLEPGEYHIEKYMFDYCELPPEAVYGLFGVQAFMTKDNRDMGCVDFTVEFREVEGECGEEGTDDEEDYE